MALNAFNHHSQFLKLLIDKKVLDGVTFSLIDVGCSGGIDSFWDQFGGLLRGVGFDPLVSEVERLNMENKKKDITYIAAWISEGRKELPNSVKINEEPFYGPQTMFNLTSASRASEKAGISFTSDVFNRGAPLIFADERLSIDEWLRNVEFGPVDILKCDVDGFDFEVFWGANDLLSGSSKPLALITEAQLHEPKGRSGTAFGDLDAFIRSKGYRLFDIDIHRYSRGALPAPFLINFAQTSTGQAMHCDALYMLDPVMDTSYLKKVRFLNDPKLFLKLLVLYEVFGLPDCAAALICKLKEENICIPNLDFDEALNDIVKASRYYPPVYKEYLSSFDDDPRKFFPDVNTSVPLLNGSLLDWTADLLVADGCFREGLSIVSPSDVEGHVCYGPYRSLPEGLYVAVLVFETLEVKLDDAALSLEVVLDENTIDTEKIVIPSTHEDFVVEHSFCIKGDQNRQEIQLRIHSPSGLSIRLKRLIVRKAA